MEEEKEVYQPTVNEEDVRTFVSFVPLLDMNLYVLRPYRQQLCFVARVRHRWIERCDMYRRFTSFLIRFAFFSFSYQFFSLVWSSSPLFS